MIVHVTKDANGKPYKFETEGHAGYDDKGKDIVCAAASVLIINFINSVEKFTEDGFRCDKDEEHDQVSFEFTDSQSEESELLFNSLLLGLESVEDGYGSRFLKVSVD
ncbi:MAG: ribosomal-processing cysteine protease Prp [Lachnospiraceae bacterium]|jgi:uncharacterized protein YsxB (DUF464 family)|nr:ribosomal-processing cysteine protease Prp [Lachnospiraceae bacterium]MEE3461095.1 ribosomal-processing cysteine protease Prp [Lachnospiraceae bacterium]